MDMNTNDTKYNACPDEKWGRILDSTASAIRRMAPAGTEFRMELTENLRNDMEMRDGEIEKLKRATTRTLNVDIFIDGREGFFITSHLQEDAIEQLVRDTIATTQLLEPDEANQLADPSRYYKGGGIDLNHCDETLLNDSPEEKMNILRTHHQQTQGLDARIISARTVYMDNVHQYAMLTSNGFYGSDAISKAEVSCILTMEGNDGQHPMEGWGETRLRRRELPMTGIAQLALERTARMIGQRPAPSGTYDMIVESSVADQLLMPVLTALNGMRLHTGTSFMRDWLDRPFASPVLNLVDDPLIPNTRGACHFEQDGTATQRRAIFEDGHLRTFFIDTPSSIRLGMAPTTEGIHHLLMQQGDAGLDGLIAQSRRAIVVTSFNGGNCDPVTGQFSYGVEGLLVENGAVVHPISGMNVSGTMHDLWQSLVATANDADPYEVNLLPSLLFRDVAFGGN